MRVKGALSMVLSFKKTLISTLVGWIALVAVSLIYRNIVIVGLAILYTGLLPFMLGVFWVSLSKTGAILREHFKAWHWIVITSWLVFSYSLYARKWTATTLNGIFHVDPEKFTITYDFLAFVYAPVSILYQPSFVSGLLNIFVALAVGLAPLFVFALLAEVKAKLIFKWSALLMGFICLVSFFLTMAGNISEGVNDVALNFALWADFNEVHTCSDDWASSAKSVIFLDAEKVLAYFPSSEDGKNFQVKSCNSLKAF